MNQVFEFLIYFFKQIFNIFWRSVLYVLFMYTLIEYFPFLIWVDDLGNIFIYCMDIMMCQFLHFSIIHFEYTILLVDITYFYFAIWKFLIVIYRLYSRFENVVRSMELLPTFLFCGKIFANAIALSDLSMWSKIEFTTSYFTHYQLYNYLAFNFIIQSSRTWSSWSSYEFSFIVFDSLK